MDLHSKKISKELALTLSSVKATIELLDEGATVPFISRYRKEATGSLDEVEIANIRDRVLQLRELDKRRESILKSISEQQKLTPELEEKINNAENMVALEDIYLPYKPKRRSRATIAKEKGLEPLALILFEQTDTPVLTEADKFIST